MSNPVCIHCGEEVFWGLPRPEDPCVKCGKPVAIIRDPDQELRDSVEEMQKVLSLITNTPADVHLDEEAVEARWDRASEKFQRLHRERKENA